MITALTLIALLTGCANTRSNAPVTSRAVDQIVVPAVIEYPAKVQDEAAAELALGKTPVLNEMIVDYGVMRDQARVALGRKVDLAR